MAYLGEDAIEFEPLEMDNIGSLGSLVLPQLPRCDDLLVRQQLGASLREFCRESDACTMETVAAVSPCRDGRGSQFPFPATPHGMVVGHILEVRSDADGEPVYFEVRRNPYPHVRVSDYLGVDGRVRVLFSVCPKAGGEECPAWFKERYAEAIVAGAMNKLLGMANRPWSDPQRAAQYGATYADAIAEAAYGAHGNEGGPEFCVPCGGLFM